MCLNIAIVDDELVEGMENFVICGFHQQQPTVVFEDNSCTNIFIKDNDGNKLKLTLKKNCLVI